MKCLRIGFLLMVCCTCAHAQRKQTLIRGELKGLRDGTGVYLISEHQDTIAKALSLQERFVLKPLLFLEGERAEIQVAGKKQNLEVLLDYSRMEISGQLSIWPKVNVTGSKLMKEVLAVEKSNQNYADYIATHPNSLYTPYLIGVLWGTNLKARDAYTTLTDRAMYSKQGMILRVKFASDKKTQGIQFEDQLSWKQVLEKAKREQKYIFLDCYTTWCSPCKHMNMKIFPLKEVGELMNKQFINVKVQLDSSVKDTKYVKDWRADAQAIKKQYEVKSMPTYLFFSPDGVLMYRTGGAVQESDQFLAMAEAALDSEKRANSQVFVKREVLVPSKAEQNLAIMNELIRKENKMISEWMADGYTGAPVWKEVYEEFSSEYGAGIAREAVLWLKVSFYGAKKHWLEHNQNLIKFIEKYGDALHPVTIGMHARKISVHTEDKEQLLKCAAWIAKGICTDVGNVNLLDGYAHLLCKLGRKNEGIAYEERALASVSADSDIKAITERLDKMKIEK